MRRLSYSSKRVFTEIDLLRGSNSWRRGRSYAASVPSNTPKDKKVRKQLSKADRRVMVEAFIDRYRALNSGKFPGIKAAQREVGGCFYLIRAIVQELEYESKNPSINTSRSETPLSKEVAKETKPVTQVEEVSSKEMIHKEAQAVAVDNTESEEVQKPKGTCEDSEHSAAHSDLLKEDTEEVLHNSPEKLEVIVKEKAPSESVLDFDDPKPESQQHQHTTKSEKFETKDSSEKPHDEEIEKKSSMWGNLKSLADGIISIWRKL